MIDFTPMEKTYHPENLEYKDNPFADDLHDECIQEEAPRDPLEE